MDITTRQARSETRIRHAYALQTAHGIDTAEMAEVLGYSLDNYLVRLRRLQLVGPSGAALKPQAKADPALERLQMELKRLLDAEELPEKSKAEALMALARAVKTVSELSAEAATPVRSEESSTVSVNEARQALLRIDRRIEELAKRRAREILGRGFDPNAGDCGGGGVVSPGA
ncbi:MAG: hypothetical protein NBV76_06375 [Candidatus Ochrobactrum gambitense]|nr:MAG: hypothetical protein NBV76_06375 [Candidatus Ochrobactrum gambitense]WEK17013.1 MAG: hypothetical protein P0Y54_04585 [Candidatus Ochrobactrum gambitense]